MAGDKSGGLGRQCVALVIAILRVGRHLWGEWVYRWGCGHVGMRGFGMLLCLGGDKLSGSNGTPVVKHVAIGQAVTRFDYGLSYAPRL